MAIQNFALNAEISYKEGGNLNKTLVTKAVPTISIGAIIIILTLLVFFLGNQSPKSSLDWLSLVFVLVSEIVVFGWLIYIKNSSANPSKRIFQTRIFSAFTVYWIINLLLALFRDKFAGNSNYFILVNILLIGIIAAIFILLNTAATRVQMLDSRTSNARLFMMNIENSLYALKTNNNYSEFKTELSSVYEKVQFSDKVGKSSYDLDLSNEVDNLKAILSINDKDAKAEVEKSISQILFFINQRNMEISQGKGGDF